MQRRQLTVLYFLLFAPIFIIFPMLFYHYFPKQAYLGLKGNTLLIILAVFLLWKKNLYLETHIFKEHAFPWIVKIFLVQAGFLILFLNGLFYISEASLRLGMLNMSQQAPWIFDQFRPLFLNWDFFPWTFLAAATVIFSIMHSLAPHSPAPLTNFLHLKRNHHWKRLFQVSLDFYATFSPRWILITGLALVLLQMFALYFQENSPFWWPLAAVIVCAGMLIVLQNSKTQARLVKLDHPSIPLVFPLLLCMFVIVLMVWIATAIFLHFHVYELKNVKAVQLQASFFQWHDRLWRVVSFLVIAPFYASVMREISSGKTLFQLVMGQMLLPAIITLSLVVLPKDMFMRLLENPSTPGVLCFLSGVALLGMCFLKDIHRVLWVGYYSDHRERKRRQPRTLLLVQLLILFMGLFATSGYSGWLNFGYSLAFGLTFIWLAAGAYALMGGKGE